MILAGYLVVLGIACAAVLADWRRGWLFMPLFAVVQDPVRKLTPNTPVIISFSILALYGAMLFSARRILMPHLRELSRRFPAIFTAGIAVGVCLIAALINGLFTFGTSMVAVPLLSFGLYVAPIPAVILGYAFLRREEQLYTFLRVYAAVTAVAMTGTMLEYWRVKSPVLGIVALQFDYYRFLPGIQIRLLSGFYRSPDIMAWHASMFTSISLVMAMRPGSRRLIWIGVAGWGFLNCILSGRRKAVYFVLAFAAAFVWRYVKRMQARQIAALLVAVLVIAAIVQNLASGETSNVYTRGATASKAEILRRFEGGLMETFRQFGLLGAGLGAATQGTRHLTGDKKSVGWQEGGLGKFAVELGLPGLLAVVLFGWQLLRMLLRLTGIRDVPGSPQFTRAMLFAFLVANVAGFMASAQAYSDAMLALMTAFLVGCLFATAALDERLAEEETVTAAVPAMA